MATTNPDEYRFRCPKNHVTIRRLNLTPNACNLPRRSKGIPDEDAYYCNICSKRYSGKPVDMLEVENENLNIAELT